MSSQPVVDGVVATLPFDESGHEALLQFLYMAPIGLVQIATDGTVEMMNPMCANLLLPFAAADRFDNLFDTLEGVAPRLRSQALAFSGDHGPVGEPVLIDVSRSGSPSTTLSLTLLKLDALRMMAVMRDATDEIHRDQLRRDAAARLDKLTDMPNRAAVCDYIRSMLADDRAAHRHGALIFIDFDRFRHINDSLGFAAGDEVLNLLAKRLRFALRPGVRARSSDAREPIAARLGGDEFVIVLDDLENGDDVHVVARELIVMLEQPLGIGTHQLRCTASMGIVQRRQFAGDADAVLQDASIAMADAKRAGGARYAVFHPQMRALAARRQDLEEDLRDALAHHHDQIFVVYQPVVAFVDHGNGAASIDPGAGVEALVRWRHPVRGLVSPLDFIGLAEERGLIGAVGRRVLETACRQFVLWRNALGARAPRKLAVNLSRGQLDEPGFVATVARVLRDTGMRPVDLQLEITESLAAQDLSIQTRLHELKALGLSLALDDFGTGYSSLASLHLLPVDTVKIDRSFVGESVTSSHHRVLIEATVRVARSLSMSTVAEGIETAEQAELIRALGCNRGQGYFFSQPLAADQLAAWLVASDLLATAS